MKEVVFVAQKIIKLRPQQQRFVDAYNGNATEAAVAAGYSKKTARIQGCKLLTNPNIAAAIAEREEKHKNDLIASREERQKVLTEILRNFDENTKERIKAIDILNKMGGDYLERVKVETNEETVFQWQE